MKKNLKKSIALTIIFVMLFSMSITVLAENDYGTDFSSSIEENGESVDNLGENILNGDEEQGRVTEEPGNGDNPAGEGMTANNPDYLAGPQMITAPEIFYPSKSLPIPLKTIRSDVLTEVEPDEDYNNIEGETEPGYLDCKKYESTIEGKDNQWQINLEMSCIDQLTTSDIVLVIDASGSMKSFGRMEAAKSAAIEFVDTLLKNDKIRIALVSFSGTVTVHDKLQPFKDNNDIELLNSSINKLKAGGGTFTQAAIRQASTLLEYSEADDKYIVLLSDGEPTYSYPIRNIEANEDFFIKTEDPWYPYWFTRDDFDEENYNYNFVAGDGTSMYTPAFNSFQYRYNYYYHHGNSAINESDFAKNNKQVIYTVGLSVARGSEEERVLKAIASEDNYFSSMPEDLDAVFQEMAGGITDAATNLVVTDPIGDMFFIPGIGPSNFAELISVNKGSVEWNDETKTIEWKISSISENKPVKMWYTVEIDSAAVSGEKYPTNESTYVDYINVDNHEARKHFPIPRVGITKEEDLDVIGYEGVYDGESHCVTVKGAISGDTVYYSTDGGESWSDENPGFINVGEYVVNIKVENPVHPIRIGEGIVKITKKPVTVTANSGTFTYDGNLKTVEGYKPPVELLSNHKLSRISAKGSGTAVGKYDVIFTGEPLVMHGEEDVTDNYELELIPGTLTITKKSTSDDKTNGRDKPDRTTSTPKKVKIPEKEIPTGLPQLNKREHFQYIQGYPDGTVKPEKYASRDEVAAVFYRLLDEKYRNSIKTDDQKFTDVKETFWANTHIATLNKGKIILGYLDGTFKPMNFITRGELAAIASRFDNLSPFESDRFTDIKGHWANPYINSAAEKGWVNGYNDGTFKPDQYITRAEFVTLVNNVLERRVTRSEILPEAKHFPDLHDDKWYYEAMQESINSHHYYRLDNGYENWIDIYYPDLEM